MKIDHAHPAFACSWWSNMEHPCCLRKEITYKHISHLPLQHKNPLLTEIFRIYVSKRNSPLTIILLSQMLIPCANFLKPSAIPQQPK